MKKFRIFPLILIVVLLFGTFSPAAAALEEPEMVAKRVVLADLETGRILYERNMTEKVSPASLTKIMTILIALEAVENGEIGMDELVTAQNDCRVGMDEESSTSGILPGEEMSLKNLIYCAMLQSANEACNIIGTRLSGSISAFVDRMNEKAIGLGCTGTHFNNTNGLTDDNHYTTAYDFYLITREAVKHPAFMEVCNTISYEVPATNMADVRKLSNSNALICDSSMYGSDYLYEGTSGVKTGYTRAAGYCLISTCERDGKHLLAVVMGSTGVLNSDRDDYGNFVDSIALYDWAFSNFEYRTLVTTEPVAEAEVALAKEGQKLTVRPAEELSALLPVDVQDGEIELRYSLDGERTAPIASGEEIAEAEIFVRGESYGRVKLVSSSTVELSKAAFMKQRLRETVSKGWFKALATVLVIFILGYAMLVARYRALRRKHMRERREAERRRRAQREQQRRAAMERAKSAAPSGGSPTQRFTETGKNEDGWREVR